MLLDSKRTNRNRRYQPRLELLEDRQLLTTFFTVTNTNDSGAGSLRQAIIDANNHANTDGDEIIFTIAGTGVHTIRPNSALPAITDPVVLDGTTQSGFSGTPVIELDGTNAGASVTGLRIAAGPTTVRGLAINRFGGNGIIVSSSNNLIVGDFIGTDPAGGTALANGGDGILVSFSTNTIGGTDSGDRNIISGNNGNGIHFAGAGGIFRISASNITVLNNHIGVNAAGTGALGNSGHGVFIDTLATNETIGGTASGAGNVISGNGGAGVRIHSGANTVQGNLIGTDVTGMSAVGNSHGVDIDSSGNTIGGNFGSLGSGPANVISGNLFSGVEIFGGVSNNKVQGNYIGTNESGSGAVGNGRNGVLITDSPNNLIGGTASLSPGLGQTGQTNIISGNLANGVQIFSTMPGTASANTVQGNLIGVDLDALTAIPNGMDGVAITGSANNLIGGIGTGGPFNNYISGNLGNGVSITGAGATGNFVQGNVIGVNQNAGAALANHLDGVLLDGVSSNTIGGTDAGAGNIIAGNAAAGIELRGAGATGNIIQANQVGLGDNSSHNLGIGNQHEGVLVSGPSNMIGGTTAAERNFIASNAGAGVTLSGPSATGNIVAGNSIGIALMVAGGNGGGIFIQGASGNTIGGTAPGAGNVISANVGDGIDVEDSGSSAIHNVIQGNFIGTDADGSTISFLGNMGSGIFVFASNNTIGGTAPGAGNLVSANTNNGVWLDGDGNLVQGNFIGTDKNGAADLGNGTAGVRISGGINNTVAGNVVSGNSVHGVVLESSSSGNTVQGNLVGTDATGLVAIGNTGDGIHLTDSSGNMVTGNVISGNSNTGLFITGASSANLVQGNLIGTGVNGTEALPNANNGVHIFDASNNMIGGTGLNARNVISGNGFNGVDLQNSMSGADGNMIQGNFIGTDISGTLNLGNGQNGVLLDGCTDTQVGGSTAAARNLISGNDRSGIRFSNRAMNNTIQGNYIGTDASGVRGLGNAGDGVFLENAPSNLVGGTTPGSNNVISSNAANGVHFLDDQAHDNIVEGNFIGTQSDGTSPLGNGQDGVFFKNASNNLIGGTDPGSANTIAFNSGNGVTVGPSAADMSTGDAILSNSIFSNGKLGIDIANDGVTPNHATSPTPGPNNFQNFPVISSVTFDSALTTTTIMGTLHSVANSTFSVQLFAGFPADPTGFGEGNRLVGSVTVMTDANGNASFTFMATPAVAIGQRITATATIMDATMTSVPRDTSEFSQAVAISTQNQRFVAQAYRDLLQREVDPTGLANFTTFLNGGGTRSAFIAAILGSHEYHILVVTAAYQLYLHRPPDAGGLNGFAMFLDNGNTVEHMDSLLVASAEYFQNRGGGTNLGFVGALYHDALNRAPDPTGLAGFDQFLAQGGARGQVADMIFSSPEYRGDLVESYYQRFLHRDADSSGLSGFVSVLGQPGARDEQVVTALVASDEYFARV
jgi:parallel beta-helix repeat protein